MTARPPRSRAVQTNTYSSSFAAAEWADDDDAWNSASDDDRASFPTSSKSSATKTLPHRSPSTNSMSYAFIQPPSPSSYPPRPTVPITEGVSSSLDWTVIRSSNEEPHQIETPIDSASAHPRGSDLDAEPDLIVGELDTEVLTASDPVAPAARTSMSDLPLSSLKIGPSKSSILPDALKITQECEADPLHALHRFHVRSTSPIPHKKHPSRVSSHDIPTKASLLRERSLRTNRRHKFIECLSQPDVNIVIADLRKLAWSGIPAVLRPIAWPLLLGYIPLPRSLRISSLARKRSEYQSLVDVTFANGRDGLDQSIWHQIEIDVPRTRPGVHLWMCGETQKSLERILYVWAIRHPASGYVQGINDLVTPFFQVFLSAYIDSDPEQFDPSLLDPEILRAIEADSFWCLSRLLDGIQDNYISAQPGIHRSVRRMAELVARIDPPLSTHLKAENVEFMQFAFRWMNCLLMREITVSNTIRMWDTYLAEGPDAFSQFHLYVCSAFLVKWTDTLREMDFQGIIMFLQSLPTQRWTDHDIELLLSEAFLLNSVWHHAQSHFTDK